MERKYVPLSKGKLLLLLVSFLFPLLWAKGTRIGPVILVINERHGWGVHLGDLLGFLVPAGVAASVVLSLRLEANGSEVDGIVR